MEQSRYNPTNLPKETKEEQKDILVDRDCAILDGKCDCPRLEGKTFPECKYREKDEELLRSALFK